MSTLQFLKSYCQSKALHGQPITRSAFQTKRSSRPSHSGLCIDEGKAFFGNIVPKIGLEVHAQLKVMSKLFSRASSLHGMQSNTQVDLLDIAIPGSLPKLNMAAVQAAMLTSLGLNCEVQKRVHFDRKNYFYADMPAGFQITQHSNPIARSGYLDFIVTTYHKSLIAHSQQYDITRALYFDDRFENEEVIPYIKRSNIRQIHLEQDSAKTLSLNEESPGADTAMLDYNRSGCGLIEIVFEPDLKNHHEASSLVKELIKTLKTLETCDCELEHGSLRVDANVSIYSIDGELTNSPRVELKNLNSLRALNKAILHEVKRQSSLITKGEKVLQESRIYNSQKDKTIPLRLKEDAVDYRYVPEPSLPPLEISETLIERIYCKLPTALPQKLRQNVMKKFNIDLIYIEELMNEPNLFDYFYEIMSTQNNSLSAVTVADFTIYAFANLARLDINQDFDTKKSKITSQVPAHLVGKLLLMVQQDDISYSSAFEVMKHVYLTSDTSDPVDIVNRFNWQQINNEVEIAEVSANAISLMKNISKNYSKKGDRKYLRMMLEKITNQTDNRINVKKVIKFIDSSLRVSK